MRSLNLLGVFSAFAISLAALPSHAGDHQTMTVFKSPWCGCCEVWTKAMEQAGIKVQIRDMEDLTSIKKQAGVSPDLEACHTALLGSYVIEGHVPLEAIEKLVAEAPDVRGIAVPGMPSGSLGMGYDANAEYTVYAFGGNMSKPTPFFNVGK